MRRTLAVALILGLVAGAMVAPAEAGKKKKKKNKKIERTAEGEYTAFLLFTDGAGLGGYAFPTSGQETFVQIAIEDLSGQSVWFFVGQDTDGDNQVEGEFYCGTELPEPLPIEGGVPVTVFVELGTCVLPPGVGMGTMGTITATFTNFVPKG
ncbi:MAG: hypothetical protein ACRDKB_14415 [Actinomycetota bacterium]